MIAYGYDASGFDTMAKILDRDILEQKAKDLIKEFPLRVYSDYGKTLDPPVVFFAHGYGGLIYEKVQSTFRHRGSIPDRLTKYFRPSNFHSPKTTVHNQAPGVNICADMEPSFLAPPTGLPGLQSGPFCPQRNSGYSAA